MKVCILQPDYTHSQVDYKNYDPPRNLSHLLPEDRVDHVLLNKATTYLQLSELKREKYDIFVNLCQGYLEWDIPSIDVILALEQLNLPYTGPNLTLYDPPKALMKYVAYNEGISIPNHTLVTNLAELDISLKHLKFPLFVKPEKAGDSLGIDKNSYITTPEPLKKKVAEIINDYDQALIEEYIEGREFTVLVVANPNDLRSPITYPSLEFVFPPGEQFKTYDLKIRQHHCECNVPCADPDLDRRLREATKKIFLGFSGVGYARVDFRVDKHQTIYFLEINFQFCVFYPEGHEGSSDYILKYDGTGQAGFLKQIIAEGIERHQRRQKKYKIGGNGIFGYGSYAIKNLAQDELIWQGEAKSQRFVTRSYVESHWTADEIEVFRRYAFPISEEVFCLWDDNPNEWMPQNHSCNPNTALQGLNLYAIGEIKSGEELTLDYSTVYNEEMLPFACQCGAPNCRRMIYGTPKMSITQIELKKRGL